MRQVYAKPWVEKLKVQKRVFPIALSNENSDKHYVTALKKVETIFYVFLITILFMFCRWKLSHNIAEIAST